MCTRSSSSWTPSPRAPSSYLVLRTSLEHRWSRTMRTCWLSEATRAWRMPTRPSSSGSLSTCVSEMSSMRIRRSAGEAPRACSASAGMSRPPASATRRGRTRAGATAPAPSPGRRSAASSSGSTTRPRAPRRSPRGRRASPRASATSSAGCSPASAPMSWPRPRRTPKAGRRRTTPWRSSPQPSPPSASWRRRPSRPKTPTRPPRRTVLRCRGQPRHRCPSPQTLSRWRSRPPQTCSTSTPPAGAVCSSTALPRRRWRRRSVRCRSSPPGARCSRSWGRWMAASSRGRSARGGLS
mmetsp:Transcript_111951/g.311153  ORF Transcript_111951/g.311153 Transcript_111951/m.311153 type:complete len:295 (-) Transcript_111951:435-1319(-)